MSKGKNIENKNVHDKNEGVGGNVRVWVWGWGWGCEGGCGWGRFLLPFAFIFNSSTIRHIYCFVFRHLDFRYFYLSTFLLSTLVGWIAVGDPVTATSWRFFFPFFLSKKRSYSTSNTPQKPIFDRDSHPSLIFWVRHWLKIIGYMNFSPRNYWPDHLKVEI
jgi:hypothetical protein